MDSLPKNPFEEMPQTPEDSRVSVERTLSMSPEFYLDPEVWDGDLYAVSAEFEWCSSDPNREGYELKSIAFEPGSSSENEIRRVLQDYVDASRDEGYLMADLPQSLPI